MKKKVVSLLLALGMLASLTGCAGVNQSSPEGTGTPSPTGADLKETSDAGMKPGVYTGTAIGRNGELSVEVTLTEKEIVSVAVTSHSETIGVADSALENIPEDIVKHQSLTVDTYTGATITCYAIMSAAKTAVEQSGADPAIFQKNVSRHGITDEVKELEADMVVVGAGAAGMAAAVSAAQNGAQSVIVLEKLSTIGGNAMVSGGFLEYMDAPEEILPLNNAGYDAAIEELLGDDFSDNEQMMQWQETVREQYARHQASGSPYVFDSKELLAMQYHVLQLGRPDETLIGYAEKSHDVCQWFTEMGVKWGPCQVIIGFPWPRWSIVEGAQGGHGYFAALTETVARESLPVEIMTETPAVELISENGTVTGVVARNIDGTTYRIKTNRVVLATGGFASNGEMLVQYNTQWENLTADVLSDNRSGTTGDGILMAQALGAGTAIMDQYMMFPLASPIDGSLSRGIDGNFAMYVNQEGRRFVDETADRNTISQAILDQPGSLCYIIGDANTSGIKDGYASGGESVEFLQEIGAVYVAGTLEELAEAMGCDPDVLSNSVAAYNEAVASFNDPEFGRVAFNEGSQIVAPPFYACPRTPTVHIILGGLTCAPTGEVISTEGASIPGLYAVGEVTAGGAALSSFADGMALGRHLFGAE